MMCPVKVVNCSVRDYLPLQQGLRQTLPSPSSQRAVMVSETIFHYNKD